MLPAPVRPQRPIRSRRFSLVSPAPGRSGPPAVGTYSHGVPSSRSGRDAGTDAVLPPLERIVFASIGLTSFALASVGIPELTLVQWRTLVLVGRGDGLRVGQIAQRTGISLPSTSRIVQRLERRGLIRTERDPRDRRAIVVTLTAAGHRVREAVLTARHELLREALDRAPGPLTAELASGLVSLADALEDYG
jgi:DNA-binding MarR family transcriptional regulator